MRRHAPFCSLDAFYCETVVVGCGAAGLNAMDTLLAGGDDDVVLVCEHHRAGTSRNTGSDKQTYYKLSLAGSDGDSVRAMAGDLYAGRCVDGDVALCEAALSVNGFLKLASLGVPFPVNRYGEYVGYQTDHDLRRRATSAGPYTSRFMTEDLERSVRRRGGDILEYRQVIRILTEDNTVRGILCLDIQSWKLSIIWCRNLVWATGGPAVMYAHSVYPESQFGSSGLAFEAGAYGRNLTEWQFGLASVRPRWNVSGSYMQVLPRFISVDDSGAEREFLSDAFSSLAELLSLVFLKGYQWPFDVRKTSGGSSLIDILVYLELQKGRRVYLDYRRNPGNGVVDFSSLHPETRKYLEQAGVCFGVPVERLRKMNEPAYLFYLEHGVDLATQPLEISLCAQHNNGGVAMDLWWRSSLSGFFPVGEVAGSHGVYRPGGSALNAGQVGSRRAALWILSKAHCSQWIPVELSDSAQVIEMTRLAEGAVGTAGPDFQRDFKENQLRMGSVAGAIRDRMGLIAFQKVLSAQISDFTRYSVPRLSLLGKYFHFRDCLISQFVYVSAMLDYQAHGGRSRGSALYVDDDGTLPDPRLPSMFRCVMEEASSVPSIQEILYCGGDCTCVWRKPNPLPEDSDFFEVTWASYRKNGNIF